MVYTLVNNGDVPDEDYFNLSLMRQTVIVCTSGTRPASPTDGMVIFETDTDQLKVYNLAAWRRTGAFDHETYGSVATDETTTITGITGTSFAAGSPVCGVAFKAPPSGGVFVTVSGRITMTTNQNEMILGWEIRTGAVVGSGSISVGASSVRSIVAGRAVNAGAVAVASCSRRYRVQAGTLTPGADHNIRTMYAVAPAGTGTVEHRELLIEPVL